MRDCDDDILFWPPAFCFGQPATSPNYSGIAISLKKMVFFYFPSVFLRNSSPCGAFRFLDQRPKTLNSWKVPQVPNGFGKSHYYCYTAGTVQQTMKSKKGNPTKWMGRFWFRKDVQAASRSCHQQHDIMTILWVPIILGSFPWSFILCLSICLHTSYRRLMAVSCSPWFLVSAQSCPLALRTSLDEHWQVCLFLWR